MMNQIGTRMCAVTWTPRRFAAWQTRARGLLLRCCTATSNVGAICSRAASWSFSFDRPMEQFAVGYAAAYDAESIRRIIQGWCRHQRVMSSMNPSRYLAELLSSGTYMCGVRCRDQTRNTDVQLCPMVVRTMMLQKPVSTLRSSSFE